MTETKQTQSKQKNESLSSNACGCFEDMFKMMQNCCQGDKGSFDCGSMMKNMCKESSTEAEAK